MLIARYLSLKASKEIVNLALEKTSSVLLSVTGFKSIGPEFLPLVHGPFRLIEESLSKNVQGSIRHTYRTTWNSTFKRI